MNIAAPHPRRRGVVLALAVLAVAVATAAVLLGQGAPSARATLNDNQTSCRGHLKSSGKDPDDDTLSVLTYTFACSNAITGFQIQPDKTVVEYETEVFGSDLKKQVVQEDAFGCQGDLPGFGINCTGAYRGGWDVITATFKVEGDACAEPRVDPLLTVMRATVDSKGAPAQAIAGPFDLGRPRGCAKSARNGKWRIPKETEEIQG